MKRNRIGQVGYSENEIAVLLREQPTLDLNKLVCTDPKQYNSAISALYLNLDALETWQEIPEIEAASIHAQMQNNWQMPDEYKQLDIAKYLLSLCNSEEELQRIGHELLLYQNHGLLDLLRYLKYLVDIITANNIVMGVGRGSSVSSFALYKLGVHQINSLMYDLPVEEFLR